MSADFYRYVADRSLAMLERLDADHKLDGLDSALTTRLRAEFHRVDMEVSPPPEEPTDG